jgi:formylglycine-generating enzyme required for sulfatase activity
VGAVTITDINTSDDYANLQFDISWDNSWKVNTGPTNWDAAWVFAKYRVVNGDWAHCTLSSTDADHTAPTGSTIDAAADGKGIFIYLSEVGSGSNDWNGAKLRWNYGDDAVADDATVTIKIFAIEMVYVPTGAFYVGSGGTESSAFYNYPTTTNAYLISNEGAITVGENEDNLYYDSITLGGDRTGPIPAAFPKGYNAFYCMKYEISQGQYVDFLNTLTGTQDATRYMTETGYRHGTWGGSAGSRTTTTPDRACNYLNWADGAAYSDWAGLRPMTELEFEKACRGTRSAVAFEYAWGTATVCPDASLTISGTEDGTETITTDVSAGACLYGNNAHSGGDEGIGPLRCGIFATGTSTRVEAGATYYGVMEMSGNLWERPVTLGNTDGRAFTGLNGDGELTTDGNADVTYWPDTTASGSGRRGGNWICVVHYLRVSDRDNAAYVDADRYYDYGFRAVRTQ